MRKVLGLVFAAAMAVNFTACDEITKISEGICGPCGTIAHGDATISGNAALDGIFKAVGTLKMSTGSINADFNARVKNLAAVFDIDVEGKATADLIAEIKGEFNAQINANVSGGIKVDFVPPRCSADISVGVSAQAQCEAKAGCDVDVSASCDPGELSFTCEGSCSGSCEVVAEGTCSAKLEAGVECTGTCTGACDLSVSGGGCEGTCSGTCDGECSLENASGECEGHCEGTCHGVCEMPSAGGSCEGECKGECTFDVEAGATCEGTFEGHCEAGCSGGCEGSFEPPSCNAEASLNCEASADCSAQAEAQASASMSCTPPSIDISVQFAANLDASAKAEVLAKLDGFKVEMIGIVKGLFELRGLIEGNAELDIEPPVVTIGWAIADFVEVVASGNFEIEAVGLLPCVIPAFEESADVLISLPTEMGATISGQLELFALLGV